MKNRLKMDLEHRKKISDSLKGKSLNHKKDCICGVCQAKRGETKGKNNPFYGKQHTEKTKQKMKENQTDRTGDKNGRYLGGLSFIKYGKYFDNTLKEKIRDRDNYRCQFCNKTQIENGRFLSVHHIDYNKKNNDINNLISLCLKCHTKTNSNREKWKRFFQNRQKKVFGQYIKEVTVEFLTEFDLDIQNVLIILNKLTDLLGTKITQTNINDFKNGFDIYYGLKESILYFGYWGEYKYIRILISSCKNYAESTIVKYLKSVFNIKSKVRIKIYKDSTIKEEVKNLELRDG